MDFDITEGRVVENRRLALLAKGGGTSVRPSEVKIDMWEWDQSPLTSNEEDNKNDDNDRVNIADQGGKESMKRGVGLIKKPPGEPGHLGSGGFNIAQVIGWPEAEFTKLQEFIATECKALFDTDKSLKFQNKAICAKIYEKAVQQYPVLRKFDQDWPVRSLMKMHLKNMSQRSCVQKMAAKIQKIVSTAMGTETSKGAASKWKVDEEGSVTEEGDSGEDPPAKKKVRI
ncbi:hypothetical protein FA15DRAFT_661610 [Coprinopsis marcescibilis]|uniref:Uncharacterized protein n=1 Tax=Coprinopsis marcescibilis TaxID=230819 RepID=A0A5C3KAU1_COPMA|nr:hypothetical protein FA15DRAFT_661610 [Coprinopsis marcescibilis]